VKWLHSHPLMKALAVAASLAFAITGLAVAAGSSGGHGKISACVSKRTGSLRVIAPGRRGRTGRCVKGELALSWSIAGPQGLIGPRGPQGLTGPQGPSGPAGPGAIEYQYALASGGTKTLGPAGPYNVSAACGTAAGTTRNTLFETNAATVGFDEVEYVPASGSPSPSIGVSSGSAPPTSTPVQLAFASTAIAPSFHLQDTITSPAGQLGQLEMTLQTSAGSCEGSIVWIPASAG
jgi:hypothetical protein